MVMKIISWNVRGLGGVEKRTEVRKLSRMFRENVPQETTSARM